MRVQKINDQQSFAMAWKVKKGGMNSRDISAVASCVHPLDTEFADADVVLSKQYCDGMEQKSKYFPINWFTKWMAREPGYIEVYVLDVSKAHKSGWERVKHLFGKGVVRTHSQAIGSTSGRSSILRDAIPQAKENYLKDPKVKKDMADTQAKVEAKQAAILERSARETAENEFQDAVERAAHYKS